MIWFEDVSSKNDRLRNPITGEKIESETPYMSYYHPLSGETLRKFVKELEYTPRSEDSYGDECEEEKVIMESHSVKLIQDVRWDTEEYQSRYSLLIYLESPSNEEDNGVSVIQDGKITKGINPISEESGEILKISFGDTTYMDLYQMIGKEYMKREVELGNYVKVEKEEVE